MSSTESVTREGARAGIAGALAVAVWFFVVDLISGQPLATPEALGAALVSVLRANQELGNVTHLIVYTVFHFAAFIVLGIAMGSALWWLALSFVMGRLKTRLGPSTLDTINRWSGILVAAFGFLLLWKAFD